MKIKLKLAQGNAVFEYQKDYATMSEAIEILQNPSVLSVTVVKETPSQYFKRIGKAAKRNDG